MADKASLTQVEIFGQVYSVKAGQEAGYVERLAGHVDAQMREISRSGGAVDSMRIAILAALNISDECFRLREQMADMEKHVASLTDSLGQAIDG